MNVGRKKYGTWQARKIVNVSLEPCRATGNQRNAVSQLRLVVLAPISILIM